MGAIRKELPALLTTLQQLYESTGDAEAFGISTPLACFTVVASVSSFQRSSNATMQRKAANFSKLQVLLRFILDEMKSLNNEKADWCASTESTLAMLETDYGIDIGRHTPGSARSRYASIKGMKDNQLQIAIPYIDFFDGKYQEVLFR